MATSNQTARSRVVVPTTPTVTHVDLAAAVEKAHPVTGTVSKLLIQNAGTADIRESYAINGTGGATDEYYIIPKGSSRFIEGIEFSGIIYMLATANQTVFIEQWV